MRPAATAAEVITKFDQSHSPIGRAGPSAPPVRGGPTAKQRVSSFVNPLTAARPATADGQPLGEGKIIN